MGARNDFFKDGGRLINTRVHGKIWLTCVACKYSMPVHKRVLDRAASPKCPACGWQMEPSEASKKKNKAAHDVQAKRSKAGSVMEQNRTISKTGRRRTTRGGKGG